MKEENGKELGNGMEMAVSDWDLSREFKYKMELLNVRESLNVIVKLSLCETGMHGRKSMSK